MVAKDPYLERLAPTNCMPVLQIAEFVARKYKISLESQDLYSLQ